MKILRFTFCALHSRQRRAGFTLIELLIVIAIIGILATLLMANFIGVQQRARDAQRKSDLRQIQSALELYKADNGTYPSGSGELPVPGGCGAPLTGPGGNPVYIQNVPCDPRGANWGTGIYQTGPYYYYKTTSTTYELITCLENKSDSDSQAQAIGAGQCDTKESYWLFNP